MAQAFHDYVLLVIILILSLILVILRDILMNKVRITNFTEYSVIEVWWTVIPGVILLTIAYPSLRLLYLMDEVEDRPLTVNTLGHQWFWEYNMPNYKNLRFESYMSNENTPLRLLDVDNRLVLPSNVLTRIVVSSVDVIHSWTVPALGVKVDAIPGRLNQLGVVRASNGLFYGQCSEICGANHRFIPIVIETIPLRRWLTWQKWCWE